MSPEFGIALHLEPSVRNFLSAPLRSFNCVLSEGSEATKILALVCRANDLGAQPSRGRSPSPEEKEFEDDDGTVYVWDSSLRKFQPRKDPSNALEAEYGADAMTFQGDDEEQPAFEMPVGTLPPISLPLTGLFRLRHSACLYRPV